LQRGTIFAHGLLASHYILPLVRASLVAQMVKNLPAVQEGRYPGKGNGYPLQY